MKRIGIIVAGSAYPMDGFESGLRNLGWVEGRGVCFELRAAEGQLQLLPNLHPNWSVCVSTRSPIAYGTSLPGAARHMAHYADRIFRGAKPGDLPIRAALSHELVLNLQNAQRLGLTVPSELLGKANRVIN
jgi:hypothetical protein